MVKRPVWMDRLLVLVLVLVLNVLLVVVLEDSHVAWEEVHDQGNTVGCLWPYNVNVVRDNPGVFGTSVETYTNMEDL